MDPVTPAAASTFDLEPDPDPAALAFMRVDHGPDGSTVVSSVDVVQPDDPDDQPDPDEAPVFEEAEPEAPDLSLVDPATGQVNS